MNVNLMTQAREDGLKFVYAYRQDGEWTPVGFTKELRDDLSVRFFDGLTPDDLSRSEIACFKTREDFANFKPYWLIDYCEKTDAAIPGSLGMWLINQSDAGYF